MTTATNQLTHNPFSTRWVRPGAVPYQFSCGTDVASLVDKLRENSWRGAIVGLHGTGKSTLLATLIPAIQASGRETVAVALHACERNLPSGFVWPNQNQILVIDGFEQLSWWRRWQVLRRVRELGCGLLVTVHDMKMAIELPTLFQTIGNLYTLRQIVDHVLPPSAEIILPRDIADAFRRNHGNIRDALFVLYDLFEKRRRAVG